MGGQPTALSGQQGGQPYYNVSMVQGVEDDPWNLMQRAGTQLGAGQFSGGVGAPNESYPSLGGGQTDWAPWEPKQYDPNTVGGAPTLGMEVPSPTDPVNPLTLVNKPAQLPEIPDYGPPPDIPPGDIFGGDMTLPGGETVGGGPQNPNPVVPKPAGGDNRTLVPKPAGGTGGDNRTLLPKGGGGLGQIGTGLAERKRDLGGGGGADRPYMGGLSPDIQRRSWSLNDPTNVTTINPLPNRTLTPK